MHLVVTLGDAEQALSKMVAWRHQHSFQRKPAEPWIQAHIFVLFMRFRIFWFCELEKVCFQHIFELKTQANSAFQFSEGGGWADEKKGTTQAFYVLLSVQGLNQWIPAADWVTKASNVAQVKLVPNQAVCAKFSSTTALNLQIFTVFSQMINNLHAIFFTPKKQDECWLQSAISQLKWVFSLCCGEKWCWKAKGLWPRLQRIASDIYGYFSGTNSGRGGKCQDCIGVEVKAKSSHFCGCEKIAMHRYHSSLMLVVCFDNYGGQKTSNQQSSFCLTSTKQPCFPQNFFNWTLKKMSQHLPLGRKQLKNFPTWTSTKHLKYFSEHLNSEANLWSFTQQVGAKFSKVDPATTKLKPSKKNKFNRTTAFE